MARRSLVIAAVVVLVIVTGLSLHNWWRWRGCTTVEEARGHVGETVSACFFVNAATSTLEGAFLSSTPLDAAGAPRAGGLTVLIPRDITGEPMSLHFFARRIKVRGRIEVKDGQLYMVVDDPAHISS